MRNDAQMYYVTNLSYSKQRGYDTLKTRMA